MSAFRLAPLPAALLCAGLSVFASSVQAQQTPAAPAEPVPLPATAAESPSAMRVEITGQRERYAVRRTGAATRSDTPVEQIPQSVVSINRNLIQDQGVTTVSDALRNASNVNSIDLRDAWNTSFKVRGFNASTVVDGVPTPGAFSNFEGLVGVDQIDVVKGPAGVLFGTGQGQAGYTNSGGTVVLSTRAADPARAVREVGLRLGSFSERAANLDLNQPLSESWALRLIGEVGRTGFETEAITQRHSVWAPSLTWQPDGRTRVVLRLRAKETRGLDYSALPIVGTLDTSTVTVPRSHAILAQDQPENSLKSSSVNLQWTLKKQK